MFKSLLSTFTQNVWPVESWRRYMSSQFRLQGAQTIIFLGDISVVMGLKIEKVGPSFSSFNPCPSLSFIATGDRKPSQSLNKVLLHFFKNMQILKFKSQQTFAFFTAVNHFSRPLGNRTWRVQKVMVCDWLFSIRFVCFCGSRLIACDCNYDWRQQKKKKQVWKWLWWALWKVQ